MRLENYLLNENDIFPPNCAGGKRCAIVTIV